MKPLKWSKRALMESRSELEYFGFIDQTRQGGRHRATLYALGWINVHWCKAKLEVPPTNKPACAYLKEKPPYQRRFRNSAFKAPKSPKEIDAT
jgi:hypothetical protein